MARVFRAAILMACILSAGRAFAAGGTCPSGSNYLSLTNPTGSLVALSSYGIASCYFIAANGVDTSTGTDESHPWAHAPGMASCSSNCANVNFGQGTQLAGIGLIFRGGDTFHFGNNTGDYTGGVWEWNPSSGGPSGTASHLIYLGVDPGWYSGSSWARPIFNADNSLCNSGTVGTMPDGATCVGTTDTFGQPSYYVSACAYQVAANGGGANDFIHMGNQGYIVVDNFELVGLCQSGAGSLNHKDTYFSYGSMVNSTYWLNNYLHGDSHIKYAGPNGGGNCNPVGVAICINLTAFNGSLDNIFFNVVDFSDSDPGGSNLTLGGFSNAAYNAIRYTTQGLMNIHLFHDNLYEYFFENGHSNVIESNDTNATNAIYDNVFRHIENLMSSGGGVGLWLGPASGSTDYIFNNLMYDVGPVEYLNVGGTALTAVQGNYVIFSNTFQANASSQILDCQYQTIGTTKDTNNHYITNASSYIGGPCSALTSVTPKLMSNSTATSDGYTSSQTYAYSPTSSSSPTADSGTNEQSFCSALSTAAGSDSMLADAASACTSDTRYACNYNSTAHIMSCPARTVVARPTTWDIGAYESNGTQATAPNPPSNLTAVVQ
jgi:hypothetical protein